LWKRKVQILFLDSWWYSVFMTLITIYALFFDDLRVIIFSSNEDDIFYFVTCLCFLIFSLEIVVSYLTNPNYAFSFFFWLDLFSTISLITDIGWVMEEVYESATINNASSILKTT